MCKTAVTSTNGGRAPLSADRKGRRYSGDDVAGAAVPASAAKVATESPPTTSVRAKIGGVVIRRAEARDATAIGSLRAAMAAEVQHLEASALSVFERECVRYFKRALARGITNVRAWVACDGERVVAAAVLMILPTLPRFGKPGKIDGRVRNIYVEPGYRRRGIARALMKVVIAEAGELEMSVLTLGATSQGRPLYESLGFVTKHAEMMYEPL